MQSAIPWKRLTWADKDRDFVALFESTEVRESGGETSLTFTARVLNDCGENVAGATLELRGFRHPDDVYATFASVSIAEHGVVSLRREITVPSDEYDAWLSRQLPRLTVEFEDASHQTRLQRVDLHPAVLQGASR